jgi:hypothetical protein
MARLRPVHPGRRVGDAPLAAFAPHGLAAERICNSLADWNNG